MLCQSLLYSQVTQLHTYRYFFFKYIFIFYLTRRLSVSKERPITQPIWVGDMGSNIPLQKYSKPFCWILFGYSSDRLEPGILYCNVCIWTNVSWSNKIQRNYKGLKITVCMSSWNKLRTRYKKTRGTQLPLLKSPEQKQGTVHVPCTHYQRGGLTT